jgi:HEAT repeat protein
VGDSIPALQADAKGGADELRTELASRLSPEMVSALVEQGQAAGAGSPEIQAVSGVVGRMSDMAIAHFVARSVGAEGGANERLAHALAMIAPGADRKAQVLTLAKEEAARGPLGRESGFEQLWQSAAQLLLSYANKDKEYVTADYARELSFATMRALEMERITDDPPERIKVWVSSLSDAAVRELDVTLLLDLLRLETSPDKWEPIARAAAAEIERSTLLGQIPTAQRVMEAIAAHAAPDGQAPLRSAAESVIQGLASGPLVSHIAVRLRTDEGLELAPVTRLCRTIGPAMVRPLASALASEHDMRAIRGLCEVLSSFGAAGRQAYEQLKGSPNPDVRRVAIDLLRSLGGREALSELTSMLNDPDPQVQQESMCAIVRLGTTDAYTVLKRALLTGNTWNHARLQRLIAIRDDRVIPLLCYVLDHTRPRGKFVAVHLEIMDTLGHLQAHAESIRRLRAALHGGQWWAPLRTARLRRAAAAALDRIGTPDTLAVLQEGATTGSPGVRSVARAQMAASSAHGGSGA